jgi:hypothetical protein
MGLIAEGVNAFGDPTLRERALYELVSIINPSPDDGGESAECFAAPLWGDAPASAAEVGKLATWILDKAPIAWRESIQPGESTVDAGIRFLDQGANAWTQILLVKHALMTAGGFSAEQVDGDLAPLIRELAGDAPVSPEIERLALYLRAEAQPGESAVDVAIRLIERLRSGRQSLVPTPEVQQVADGVHTDAEQVDDRDGGPGPQPNSITAAVDAYRKRTGTS